MTTGSPTSTAVKTEAFDVVASTTCQSLPAYPFATEIATGAFVNSKLVICGGTFDTIGRCYSLSQNEAAWKSSGNLIAPRKGAASAAVNNTLVIFGGYYTTLIQSTEEIDVETGTATAGPNMPLAVKFHCAVTLNTTTVLIIGGFDGSSYFGSTYFYNVNVKSFTSGPSLTVARGYHGCSILTTGTERFVVVTGGFNGVKLDSTEVMDLNQPTMWQTGL